MGIEQAVFSTFAGKQAKKFGFTKIRIDIDENKLHLFIANLKPDTRWSVCSEISGQFNPKNTGQFDRLFQTI